MYMEKTKVNNYKCSIRLIKFKKVHLLPIQKRFEEGRKVMENPKQKWDNEGKKRKAELIFKALKLQYEDYLMFLKDIQDLCNEHESLVTTLSELYALWYNKVSNDGSQPKEMMGIKAKRIEEIFGELYKTLKPLGLEIEPPASLKK